MNILELKKYNHSLLDNYHFEKNAQKIVMPGLIKGDILFLFQNPGNLKNDCEGDREYMQAYEERNIVKLDTAYEKALRDPLGTAGSMIVDLIGDSWEKISFINVFKTPFIDNKLEIENEQFHLDVLKKQLALLEPKKIITVGRIAAIALQKIGYKADLELQHPSFLKRNGIYKDKIQEYANQIEELLYKKFITNCEVINHTDVHVRYNWKGEKKNKVIKNYPFHFYILDENGEYTRYDGKKAKKMYFSELPFSWDEKKLWIAEHKKELCENDVYENIKFLIEEECEFDTNQSMAYFDIETDLSFSTIEVDKPVISLSVVDNKDAKAVWTWKSLQTTQQDVWNAFLSTHEEIKNDIKYFYFDNEKDCLEHFFKFMASKQYDCIAGWNSSVFDIPYLLNRAAKIGAHINLFSSLGHTSFKIGADRESARFRIMGMNHIDLLQVYKKVTYDNRSPSYQLGAVAKHLINDNKLDLGNVADLWRNDIDKLLEYNLHDAIITKKIDEKARLGDLLKVLQNISLAPLDLCLWNKNVVDCYILRTYNKKYVFPDIQDNKRVEFEGAVTGKLKFNADGSFEGLAPDAGLFKNVAVIDFSSMYSTIFLTFNISPETVDENGDIVISDVRFTSKKAGLVPALYDNLLKRRKEYEKIRDTYDRSSQEWYIMSNFQAAIKTVLNSIYGISGYPKFRLFNPKVARSITHVGRNALAFVWKKVEALGYEPLYSDTDSVFIKLGDNLTQDECIAKAEELEYAINMCFEEFVSRYKKDSTNYLKVDCEKIYEGLLLLAVKKRYIGKLMYKKGQKTAEIQGRGIEINKKDVPTAFKPFFKTLVEKLINNEKDILKFVNAFKKEIKLNYTLQSIAVRKNISKNINDYKVLPIHVRAAKVGNAKLKMNFQKSDVVSMIYVKNSNTDVIGIDDDVNELPKGYQIDWSKYFDMFIDRKLDMFNSVQNLSNQKTLKDFFTSVVTV